MYKNINIILATKHKKEVAIQKPFEDAFNANIVVPNDFDTDQFGTFTGEIPRHHSAYDTVIKKAKAAATKYKFDYAIANEGSFGPHPTLYFVPADIELMSFYDRKRDIVIIESETSLETNYGHLDIKADDDVTGFLERIKFGSHGLIVRSPDDNNIIAKSITEHAELRSILKSSFKKHTTLRLETDMRAMMNPTRMNVINKLAKKLALRLQQECPECKTPGFGKASVKGSLLCEDCDAETVLFEFKVLSCVKCSHETCMPRPDGRKKAEPQYCPQCNP